MAFLTTGTSRLKTDERRRSQRIPFRAPVLIEGKTVDGKPFEEKTYTLEINRHGARIVLQSSPQPGGRVSLTNLQTKAKCAFQVVNRPGKPLEKDKGAEWGIECLDSRVNFWGISFPDREEDTRKPGEIDFALECSRCHTQEQVQLTPAQYQAIVTQTSVTRNCLKCNAMTKWNTAYPQGDGSGECAPPLASPIASRAKLREERQERRLAMRLPVRIRQEDIGETENLSPHGLCLSSEILLKVGDRIYLTVGYAPGGNEKEVTARVMWRKEIADSKRALYGVRLEHDQ